MTSAAAIQEEMPARTFVMCGVLSLVFHACLLTGLSLIQTAKPAADAIPVVKVTLLPTEVPTEPESANAAPETEAPPLQTVPRRTPPPPVTQTQPIQPRISQPQPLRATAALTLDPMPTPIEPQTPLRKSRTLKDTFASDALFAQSATKMVKRSRTSVTAPSSVSNAQMTVSKLPAPGPLQASNKSIETTSRTSWPSRTRRLTASLPATKSLGMKIAVRHSVRPVYPRIAKEEGWEGIVLLRVLVHSSGMPGKVTIQKSSGYKVLDEAAIDAIRQWRFAPAKDGNFAIEKHVDVPLKFGLHG